MNFERIEETQHTRHFRRYKGNKPTDIWIGICPKFKAYGNPGRNELLELKVKIRTFFDKQVVVYVNTYDQLVVKFFSESDSAMFAFYVNNGEFNVEG